MISYILHSHRMNLDYLRKLVADVPEERMCEQPKVSGAVSGDMNHPAWVVGHVVFSANMLASVLGEKVEQPANWEALFGMKSKPTSDRKAYPTKAALLKAAEEGYARNERLVRVLSAAQLAEPFPIVEFRSFFPTLGDAVVFMCTTHDAVHLGQLSAWRRVLGLPSVM